MTIETQSDPGSDGRREGAEHEGSGGVVEDEGGGNVPEKVIDAFRTGCGLAGGGENEGADCSSRETRGACDEASEEECKVVPRCHTMLQLIIIFSR